MRKKVYSARANARAKRFEEPVVESTTGDGRRMIDFSAISRHHKILIGVAGANGWRDIKWAAHSPDNFSGIPPGYPDGNYYILNFEIKVDDNSQMVAAIYLASIGETLD